MSTQFLINKRKAGNLHRQVKPSIAYSYIWRLNLSFLTTHQAFQLRRWSFWLQSIKRNFSQHRALLAIPWISIPYTHTKLASTSHLGNRSHSVLVVSHKDRKCNPTSVLLKPEARNKIRVSFAPRKKIKEHYGKVKETVKRKHLPPQNPMQPVETWIAFARTRKWNPKLQPVQEDDPTPLIADTLWTLLPSIYTSHWPSLTILYTW
jgi:hypothetical protein